MLANFLERPDENAVLPLRHLPTLTAAERAIGRLDAALADAADRRRHTPAVLRSGVLATLQLDGIAVAEEELVLVGAAQETVAPGNRAAAEHAGALLKYGRALDSGHFSGAAAPLRTGLVRSAASFTTAGLQAVLEGLALLEEDGPLGEPMPEELPSPPRHHPWTPDWGVAAFTGWLAVTGRPEAPADAAEAVVDGLHAVERLLAGAPGLVGASRALLALHHRADPPQRRRSFEDPFETPGMRRLREKIHTTPPTGFWPTLARLAAPSLLRRACGLDHARLPLAVPLAGQAEVFRGLLAGPEDQAVAWVVARIADQAEAEQRVLTTLDRWDRTRREALKGLRRDAAALALLDHLWDEPAVTVGHVTEWLGVSRPAARSAIAMLMERGILRGVPAWQDETIIPPRRTAQRPLAYLAVEPVATVSRPTPSRKRRTEPPTGTPMHWQPIDTASPDGKRRLVWAGRPVMALYGPPVGAAPPVWRDGRRVIQPTHWLPIAPPGAPTHGED